LEGGEWLWLKVGVLVDGLLVDVCVDNSVCGPVLVLAVDLCLVGWVGGQNPLGAVTTASASARGASESPLGRGWS